ncbi:DUF4410 domain-containing protein [Pseudoalteromonas luteoviolacea]|uniref:DUF4410 domain-containing protein n=1 Tax=Pseudoalteromonas luteoviolacea S4060-1 TaxID=1365257 RepID=A0A161YJ63_9GAMM|nr:DUF4410 domain-containing protein [Pseudoalteromonas luteoviolacea]KZN61240.1 hypothetical protein N478_04045 [Pseudoalteromonas luteoviolacea S4060-1]
MFNKIIILTIAMLLTACSSSTKISQAIKANHLKPTTYSNIVITNNNTEAPEHFADAVKSYLKQELKNNAIYKKAGGSNVTISINGYRMRSGFSRAMFGMFAGKDGVDSEVVVTDAQGDVIGKSTISSYNIMAIGDMQDIARMHAEEIAKFLRNDKQKKS